MDIRVPCTTPDCPNEKYFPGRCNPCQSAWERENLVPLGHSRDHESWVDEQMRKQSE